MAQRLEDDDARIAALAQLFFHELAKKEYKVGAAWKQRSRRLDAAEQADAHTADYQPRSVGLLPRSGAQAEGWASPALPCLACQLFKAPPRSPPAPAPVRRAQGTSPIYNLLPDILSNLSKERGLGKAQFQSIMQHVSRTRASGAGSSSRGAPAG